MFPTDCLHPRFRCDMDVAGGERSRLRLFKRTQRWTVRDIDPREFNGSRSIISAAKVKLRSMIGKCQQCHGHILPLSRFEVLHRLEKLALALAHQGEVRCDPRTARPVAAPCRRSRGPESGSSPTRP